jgi:hypothetical protein
MVEWPYFGRKGTLALSTGVFPSYSIYVSQAHAIITVLTGVFLFASTTARTSPALLGWNCGYSFTSNVMYGVLYALSPELFPSPVRGTGNAVVAVANRVFGIMVSSSQPPVEDCGRGDADAVYTGPHRCSLRRSYHECAYFRQWGVVPCCWSHCASSPIRAPRKGCSVGF